MLPELFQDGCVVYVVVGMLNVTLGTCAQLDCPRSGIETDVACFSCNSVFGGTRLFHPPQESAVADQVLLVCSVSCEDGRAFYDSNHPCQSTS